MSTEIDWEASFAKAVDQHDKLVTAVAALSAALIREQEKHAPTSVDECAAHRARLVELADMLDLEHVFRKQADAATVAMRDERDAALAERDALRQAVTEERDRRAKAEAMVKALTEANDALRIERDEARRQLLRLRADLKAVGFPMDVPATDADQAADPPQSPFAPVPKVGGVRCGPNPTPEAHP
jgi:hypothetical protein